MAEFEKKSELTPLEIHLQGLFELSIGSKDKGGEWIMFNTTEARNKAFLRHAVVSHVLGENVDYGYNLTTQVTPKDPYGYAWAFGGHLPLDENIALELVNRARNISTDPEYERIYTELRKRYVNECGNSIGLILQFMEEPNLHTSWRLHEYLSRFKNVMEFLKIGKPPIVDKAVEWLKNSGKYTCPECGNNSAYCSDLEFRCAYENKRLGHSAYDSVTGLVPIGEKLHRVKLTDKGSIVQDIRCGCGAEIDVYPDHLQCLNGHVVPD
jgi:hypothetical protein